MQRRRTRRIAMLLSILVAVLGISSVAVAADHVRGVVAGRAADGSLIVHTDDAEITVVLTESTKVRETSGIRVIDVDVASLIPGLRIAVEGTSQTPTHFAADRIVFTRDDLKTARDIAAGIIPTNETVQANQQQNNERFTQQQASLDQQGRRITDNDQKIVATNGRIEATNSRIANLDDYTVVDTMTVYFRNAQATIAPDFQAQLRQLAEKAKGLEGYSVQVEGYASAVGSYALNQRLSQQRAENVASLLAQSGIPSTKMFFPAAMGVSDQVASNTTKDGQAQNRRAVVRLLQNRGITGN